ncbi:Flp pilus assembly protein CpaB [Alcanivorax profundi]|uniref:Flp pilus assembly protein CpaB n=1 Tax=Alcanivorax profundi TaxID=2338368 RepID=A0A418XZ91_9GAMM|nr:Flp pilus assembly protein CpaB [Alcanivorax profundi]RJG18327.1 Flp pilus assembly protein CpaB [Alcanivorax profundi]
MGSRLLYMLPALVVALVALILALAGLNRDPAPSLGVDQQRERETQPQAPAYRYWVVTESLNVGDTLEEESLAVVSSPAPIANVLNADEKVVGKALRQFARPGELLSRNHLEPGGTLPGNVPAGFRAVAVAVDDVVMAGGLLQPGDLVDVVVAFRKGMERDNPAAMVLLNHVQVLAVKGAMAVADTEAASEAQRRNHTVVLAVPGEKVPALLLAAEEGVLRLAVVASEDKAVADTSRAGKPVYFRDLFPAGTKSAPKAAPGQRVEVYEGSDSRSTYVR